MFLQELTWIIAIISFVGSIAIFIFRKIVIDPLQISIDSLNETLKEFKVSTDKELEIHEKEIALLKEKTTRHDEQLKTLFRKGVVKNELR